MQLSFDTANADELAAVAALIAHMRGDDTLHNDIAAAIAGHNTRRAGTPMRDDDAITFDEGGTQADRLVEPDAPDPAVAFGAVPNAVSPAAPSPAAVTIPQPPAPLPNPGGVEVDAAGFPWDARIHSGPADKKPRNGDQTWRRKRGATDDEVRAVEAELRAALGAPAAPFVPTPHPPVTAPPVAAAPIPVPPAPAPTPEPAAMASGPAAVIPAPDAPATDFASLMRKITARQTAGVLTVEGTGAICAALGITGIRDLVTRPDLVPAVDALLPDLAAA